MNDIVIEINGKRYVPVVNRHSQCGEWCALHAHCRSLDCWADAMAFQAGMPKNNYILVTEEVAGEQSWVDQMT